MVVMEATAAVSEMLLWKFKNKVNFRSFLGEDSDLTPLSSMINKIDDVLGQNNIDSTSCMQRAVCGYVRSTEYNMKIGSSDQMDEFIHMLAEWVEAFNSKVLSTQYLLLTYLFPEMPWWITSSMERLLRRHWSMESEPMIEPVKRCTPIVRWTVNQLRIF